MEYNKQKTKHGSSVPITQDSIYSLLIKHEVCFFHQIFAMSDYRFFNMQIFAIAELLKSLMAKVLIM